MSQKRKLAVDEEEEEGEANDGRRRQRPRGGSRWEAAPADGVREHQTAEEREDLVGRAREALSAVRSRIIASNETSNNRRNVNNTKWKTWINDNDGSHVKSWAGLLTHEEADLVMKAVEAELAGLWRQDKILIYGSQWHEPRLKVYFGERVYSYHGVAQQARPFTALFRDIMNVLGLALSIHEHGTANEAEQVYNSLLVTMYRKGSDSISWHSDDEPCLGHRPNISSLSLGESRVFCLRHKCRNTRPTKIMLNHGDMLHMGGATQEFWEHSIPKSTNCSTPLGLRISFTARKVLFDPLPPLPPLPPFLCPSTASGATIFTLPPLSSLSLPLPPLAFSSSSVQRQDLGCSSSSTHLSSAISSRLLSLSSSSQLSSSSPPFACSSSSTPSSPSLPFSPAKENDIPVYCFSPKPFYGELPNIKPGSIVQGAGTLWSSSLHRNYRQGISYTSLSIARNGKMKGKAARTTTMESIKLSSTANRGNRVVLMDGCDCWEKVYYVGEGSPERNQTMTRGNLAMLRAYHEKQPIRVVESLPKRMEQSKLLTQSWGASSSTPHSSASSCPSAISTTAGFVAPLDSSSPSLRRVQPSYKYHGLFGVTEILYNINEVGFGYFVFGLTRCMRTKSDGVSSDWECPPQLPIESSVEQRFSALGTSMFHRNSGTSEALDEDSLVAATVEERETETKTEEVDAGAADAEEGVEGGATAAAPEKEQEKSIEQEKVGQNEQEAQGEERRTKRKRLRQLFEPLPPRPQKQQRTTTKRNRNLCLPSLRSTRATAHLQQKKQRQYKDALDARSSEELRQHLAFHYLAQHILSFNETNHDKENKTNKQTNNNKQKNLGWFAKEPMRIPLRFQVPHRGKLQEGYGVLLQSLDWENDRSTGRQHVWLATKGFHLDAFRAVVLEGGYFFPDFYKSN